MDDLLFDSIPTELREIIVYYCEPISCITLYEFDLFNPIIKRGVIQNYEDGSEIIDSAIETGNIPFMEQIMNWGIEFDDWNVATAAKYGQLTLCKWLHSLGNIGLSHWICTEAARGGQLETLKWARENGYPWEVNTFLSGMKGGNLEVVKYLYENECPQTPININRDIPDKCLDIVKYLHDDKGLEFSHDILDDAVRSGSLDLVKYLRENNCRWRRSTLCGAALNGHLHIIQWCVDNGCQIGKRVFTSAASGGHMDVIEYLYGINCPRNEGKCLGYAALKGNYDLMLWFRDRGFNWNEYTFSLAAEGGNMTIIKYLHENKCLWNSTTFVSATKHIEVMKYLYDNQCPWDEKVLINTGCCDINTIIWLCEKGCPYDKQTICSTFARSRNLDALKYMYERGCILDETVFENGVMDIEVAEWLYKKQCPMNERVYKHAIKSYHLDRIKWLHEHNCPWTFDTYILASKLQGNIVKGQILQYLQDNGCPMN